MPGEPASAPSRPRTRRLDLLLVPPEPDWLAPLRERLAPIAELGRSLDRQAEVMRQQFAWLEAGTSLPAIVEQDLGPPVPSGSGAPPRRRPPLGRRDRPRRHQPSPMAQEGGPEAAVPRALELPAAVVVSASAPAAVARARNATVPGPVRHRGVEVVPGIWLNPMGLTDDELREDCREAARMLTPQRRPPSIATSFGRKRSRRYDPKTIRKMIDAGRVLLGKT